MRIISGLFKGKKILEPKDFKTRPLKDLTKESIFNIINHSKKFTVNLKKTRNVLDDEIKLVLAENKKNYEEKARAIEDDYEKKKKELNEKLLDSRNDLVKKVPEICVSLSDQLFEKIMNEKSKGNIKDFNAITKKI